MTERVQMSYLSTGAGIQRTLPLKNTLSCELESRVLCCLLHHPAQQLTNEDIKVQARRDRYWCAGRSVPRTVFPCLCCAGKWQESILCVTFKWVISVSRWKSRWGSPYFVSRTQEMSAVQVMRKPRGHTSCPSQKEDTEQMKWGVRIRTGYTTFQSGYLSLVSSWCPFFEASLKFFSIFPRLGVSKLHYIGSVKHTC